MGCCETDKVEVSSANSFFQNLFNTLLPYIQANAGKIITWLLGLLPQPASPALVSLTDSYKASPSKETFEAVVKQAHKEGANSQVVVEGLIKMVAHDL